MRVEYHPSVQHDVAEATRRYQGVSDRLGEEFKAELRRVIAAAAANPNRFHPIKPGFHQANLKRFPYHFLPGRSGRDSRDARAASSAASEIRDGTGVGWLRQHDREWEAEAELDVSKLAGTLSVLIPNRRL